MSSPPATVDEVIALGQLVSRATKLATDAVASTDKRVKRLEEMTVADQPLLQSFSTGLEALEAGRVADQARITELERQVAVLQQQVTGVLNAIARMSTIRLG